MRKLLLVLSFVLPVVANAATSIRMLSTDGLLVQSKVEEVISQNFDVNSYREIGVQAIMDGAQHLDHLLVHLHFKNTHRVEFAAVYVDSNMRVVRVIRNYQLNALDKKGQPNSGAANTCPDPSIEFIAFAPNDDTTEQGVTVAVAQAATAAGLKVVQLLKADATRVNYLNYMACPNLKGNFYDGDSNPQEFVTVDGAISSSDMMTFNFNYKVTNIWVACEAFNDPMKSAVISTAKSQKYAAGINDLEVGPSDNAAKCAMIAAVQGQPMTAAFQACYKQYDVSSDQWGFDGGGADTFSR